MASKIRLSIFATMVAVVLVSAALAASSISFYIDGSPVDNDEVFDFDNQNVSVSVVADGYSGDPATGTLYVTYGSENISKTITYGNDKYSTPS
ncbi:MAG: hypothetical protein QF535_10615, partial [Anaerolineales bacterium]|nr:hypothetical protein [Anaerolineales bacterium]